MIRNIVIIIVILLTYTSCFSERAHADSIILLDPGHTKIRYGTKSCSGGVEYKYNNEMSDFIEEYLKQHNVHVMM
ncbi:MAG: N-acetylmuramoyl-L-alanine amidase, partial [Desulfovibrio sp.]|nr:N-acetylmuramoyl-L-alanine amidase [Desulfovibrio sp.]